MILASNLMLKGLEYSFSLRGFEFGLWGDIHVNYCFDFSIEVS